MQRLRKTWKLCRSRGHHLLLTLSQTVGLHLKRATEKLKHQSWLHQRSKSPEFLLPSQTIILYQGCPYSQYLPLKLYLCNIFQEYASPITQVASLKLKKITGTQILKKLNVTTTPAIKDIRQSNSIVKPRDFNMKEFSPSRVRDKVTMTKIESKILPTITVGDITLYLLPKVISPDILDKCQT